jgi:hypothetical protein
MNSVHEQDIHSHSVYQDACQTYCIAVQLDKFYCNLCYNLVVTCIFGVLYLVSLDDGASQPNHVLKIKTCAIFTHERILASKVT